jgi:N-acyl-L-homoserine lactone synthetase
VDQFGVIRGSSTLNPTNRPYMLKDACPAAIRAALPESDHIWEGNSICIEKDIDDALRERIKQEIVIGYLEFGLTHNIEKYVSIMPAHIWQTFFIQTGWDVSYPGDELIIDKQKTRAGEIIVSKENLERVRQATKIFESVLSSSSRLSSKAASVKAS